MAKAFKLATTSLPFFLFVLLWLSCIIYVAEPVRPRLNGGKFPAGDHAAETHDGTVFKELPKGVVQQSTGLSAGVGEHKYKYPPTTGVIGRFGPSPGDGHKNVPSVHQ
ncbi:hypothetical protein I3843_06G160800 [Carya illinoinensis]|uniref:Transmembrane protein n=1 Tax=Carya illinoinensis TaxID=32201 RepID=A0A8T1QCJ5_CARIL|nr:hypothetical protein I3760_06G170200 [Carya illinoinensis]KAG6652216.1 hypothetical protein CIPAW_06G169100 [Carya illinoinensis]KAG6710159.1 hypothetical protein I3842_06G170100 [Carya illinoinensis]KAG7976641.1 hypothetical protein I3843_06G160800 [Carya illinoinensis]